MMATTKGTTQGTPCRATPSTPRLMLQIATSAVPAAAVTAIVRIVMLTGGALRPLERRPRGAGDGEEGEQSHQHHKGDPARERGHVAVDEVVEDTVDDREHAPDRVLVEIEQVDQESGPEKKAPEGHDERGQVEPGDERALQRTDEGAGAKAHDHARPPGPAVGGGAIEAATIVPPTAAT